MSNNKNSKKQKEWFFDLPWGKLAMISWGSTSKPPVLLLHGYMDNAGTFSTLVDYLPDTHYYVSFDMPGHGKSDPFPLGPLLNQAHITEVMHQVVQMMKWKTFMFIGHSMGCIIAWIYNRVYPGRMLCFVALDPEPPLSNFYFSNHMEAWYNFQYPSYYAGLDSSSTENKKYYTRDEMISHVMRRRELTAAQARPIVERSLVPVGNGVYKLSFEKNAKSITTLPMTYESFLTIITTYPIPLLMLHATKAIAYPVTKKATAAFFEEMRSKLPYLEERTIETGHDLHLTNAVECSRYINEFLRKDFGNKKSKL